jgi:type IV pilus assembly protein PilY1
MKTTLTVSGFRHWSRVLLLGGLYALGASGVARADDTEIFFPAEVVQADDEVLKPNILFLMDTSGSMGSTDNTGQTRLRRVQDALQTILRDLSPNVNVGIGRLSSTEGGAILWPVSAIDAAVADVYPSSAAVEPNVVTGGGSNEAQQVVSTVTTNPGSLNVGIISSSSSASNTTYYIDAVKNEAEQYTSSNNSKDDRVDTDNGDGTRSSADIELRENDNSDPDSDLRTRWAGLRYEGFSLPAGATISSAHLVFTCASYGSGDLDNVRIYAEDTNYSDQFSTQKRNISNRSRTSNYADWDNVPTCYNGSTELTSPDLKNAIQEVTNRSGWQTGNPMTFIIDLGDSGDSQRVTRARQGGNRDVAPRLVVEYNVPAVTLGERAFGLRFPAVDIPAGVTVTSARITFKTNPSVDLTLNSQALTATIGVQNSINPPSFSTASNDVTSRSTAGTVSWNIPAFSVNGQSVSTPDLTSLVNTITSSTGWCGGSPMVFTFVRSSGDALRSFFSTAADNSSAPVLELSYSAGDVALDTGCQADSTAPQIAGSANDAEQAVSNGSMSLSSSDLELGQDGTTKQIVGMRFQDVAVPQGATVTNAYIEFTAKDSSSGTLNLSIKGENVDNAAAFSSTSSEISTRLSGAGTSASTAWTPGSWSDGNTYDSPSLTAIVQEIVNRGGWTKGNAMAMFVSTSSSSNTRRAYSVDGSASRAPRLIVEFQGAPGRQTVRQYLRDVVEDFQADGYTPIPEMLYEANRYFRGDEIYYGKTRGDGNVTGDNDGINPSRNARISHPATWDASRSSGATQVIPSGCTTADYNNSNCTNEYIDGTAYYQTPFEAQECTSNSIVMLSDGLPNQLQSDSITRIQSLVGKNCVTKSSDDGDSNDGSCATELAEFMHTVDQSGTMSGDQLITTYTIGFANLDASQYLTDVATAGGGDFYPASTSEAVVEAFRSIVSSILDINTTFVAPAVTVNTFNRLTTRNEIYFALFRPQPETRWEGNLKRYVLGGDPVEIQDAQTPPVAAVDPTTGFFKTTSKSWWGAAADGDQVSKGGVIEQFPTTRNVYTYTGSLATIQAGGSTSITPVDLTANTNLLHENTTQLTKTLLGDTSMSDAQRTQVVQFSRGLDINDDNGDGITNERRQSLGDPLHSEPLLITYGGTDANPDITIFFGTNEGGLHAINAATGQETFAFVPQELLPNLKTFQENTSGYLNRPYGVDGQLSTMLVDPDGDLKIVENGSIQANNKAYLYFGLRRGGRQFYALDVTNRSSPTLMYEIRGGGTVTNKYRELGQTWSRAIPTVIKYNNAAKRVIIFTGGYDDKQDDEAVPSADTMGRAVFIADAVTGERLWWAGIDPETGDNTDDPNLVVPQMQFSIPASPKVVDMNGDGYADRIYVADVSGQVFRFILNPAATNGGNLATVSRIAQLGGGSTGTAAEARRFYVAPDVALISKNVSAPYLSIAIGSGYRAHPLNKVVQDRFYVFKDPDAYVSSPATTFFRTDIADGDDTNDLYDATDNLLDSTDPDVQQDEQDAFNAAQGFYINIGGTGIRPGEKVLTESRTFDNKVLFASFQPGARSPAQACQASTGLSRLYLFDVVNGTPVRNFSDNPDDPNDDIVDDPRDPGDSSGEDNELAKDPEDRYVELSQGGLPPDLSVLFPSVDATLPQEALVCVGPECFNPGLAITTEKTFWIKKQ